MNQARFPKRCNGAIKIGKVHFDSIKLAVIVMVFALASSNINIGVILAVISVSIVESMYKKFGRGVLKHMLWINGFWITSGKQAILTPAIRRLIK
ncbi:hypothetical protein L5M38_20500 [Shewanella sp. SM101]|jgi:hypothetical protein|nr:MULTISPECIES: type IV conjugative transfer system protein TraL [Shewanella]AEH16229.1 hypothetical protein Sbal117_4591 [Shewanella baltica OS117]MCU8008952.1 hypothetical protein [Shewanella sp. SM87]MCU8106903.1 hypothetical protein [Shewanella sp. SM101]